MGTEMMCFKCKKQRLTNVVTVTNQGSRNVFMVRGKCTICDTNTCAFVSQSDAASITEHIESTNVNPKKGEVKKGEVKNGEVKKGEVKKGEVKKGEVKKVK